MHSVQCAIETHHPACWTVIQSNIFRQKPDALARGRMSKRMTEHQTASAAGEHETKSNVDGGGLPCPVRPKEAENLTRLNPQRKSIQSFDRLTPEKTAVLFADVVEFEGRGHEEPLAASN